ncbi:hypothetical protein PENTCL1PPCAC_22299, partial [Pristionchus entomophagus]
GKCVEQETFDLTAIEKIFKFSGDASECNRYEKVYKFNPNLNATKGRSLSVTKYSGRYYLNFEITEFTTHPNGSIDRRIYMWFAATTGIMVNFTRKGGYRDDYYY